MIQIFQVKSTSTYCCFYVFYKADTNTETFICSVCSLFFSLLSNGIVKSAFRNFVKRTAISIMSLKIFYLSFYVLHNAVTNYNLSISGRPFTVIFFGFFPRSLAYLQLFQVHRLFSLPTHGDVSNQPCRCTRQLWKELRRGSHALLFTGIRFLLTCYWKFENVLKEDRPLLSSFQKWREKELCTIITVMLVFFPSS